MLTLRRLERDLHDGPQQRLVRRGMDEAAARCRPDVAVVDVRMPPGMTDDGLRAAVRAARSSPGSPS